MFDVIKVKGGYAVIDWEGNEVVAYRSKAIAEIAATNCAKGLFTAAEEYDLRRTATLQYLAKRTQRAPSSQLELF